MTVTDVIAAVALGLSLLGLGLQLLVRHLDGGRVRVYLRPLIYSPVERAVRSDDKGAWPFFLESYDASTAHPSEHMQVDLAEIVVENVGRLPVTLAAIELAVLSEEKWRERAQRWARRHRMSGPWWRLRGLSELLPWQWNRTQFHPYELWGRGQRFVASAEQHQLQPYSRISVLVDPWALMPPNRVTRRGKTIMRGAASIPGRAPKLSRWWWRWEVPDAAVSSTRTDGRIRLMDLVARVLFTRSLSESGRPRLDNFAIRKMLRVLAQEPWPEDREEQLARVEAALAASILYTENDEADLSSPLLFLPIALQQSINDYGEKIEWDSGGSWQAVGPSSDEAGV